METDRLLPTTITSEQLGEINISARSHYRRWQHLTGETLESQTAHRFIITLISIDAICVITDLSYVFLSPGCGDTSEQDDPLWLEVLSHISLVINLLFLIEIPLAIWAFSWRYYSPVSRTYPHAGFHFLDALVILGSVVVDLFLRGRDKELASLIVVFRLWRIVKVVGGVAVGVGEYSETAVKELNDARREVEKLESRVKQLEAENDALKRSV